MIVDLAREMDNPEGVSKLGEIMSSLRDWDFHLPYLSSCHPFGIGSAKSGLLVSKLRALYKTDT